MSDTSKSDAKHHTQAMVDDGREGAPDGTGIPGDTRGAGGGGPTGPKDEGDGFHGGQSDAAYHGHGQLGKRKIEGESNPNSPSREP